MSPFNHISAPQSFTGSFPPGGGTARAAGSRHRLLRALVFSPLLGAAGLAASIGFIAGSIAAACVATASALVRLFSTHVVPELGTADEPTSDGPSSDDPYLTLVASNVAGDVGPSNVTLLHAHRIKSARRRSSPCKSANDTGPEAA